MHVYMLVRMRSDQSSLTDSSINQSHLSLTRMDQSQLTFNQPIKLIGDGETDPTTNVMIDQIEFSYTCTLLHLECDV